ncbi:unnamed protein product [Candida parapsilosis]
MRSRNLKVPKIGKQRKQSEEESRGKNNYLTAQTTFFYRPRILRNLTNQEDESKLGEVECYAAKNPKVEEKIHASNVQARVVKYEHKEERDD